MPIPELSSSQISHLSRLAAEFIQQQRDKNLAAARPMSEAQQDPFRRFFPEEVLRGTRFCSATIEDPPFYPALEAMGIAGLPTAKHSAAITYIDVIVAQQKYTDALRFHEMVHAVQYRVMGVERFAEAYVRGFLSGGGYMGIPLEKNAYELEARFAANHRVEFDVVAEVKKWKF